MGHTEDQLKKKKKKRIRTQQQQQKQPQIEMKKLILVRIKHKIIINYLNACPLRLILRTHPLKWSSPPPPPHQVSFINQRQNFASTQEVGNFVGFLFFYWSSEELNKFIADCLLFFSALPLPAYRSLARSTNDRFEHGTKSCKLVSLTSRRRKNEPKCFVSLDDNVARAIKRHEFRVHVHKSIKGAC